MISIGSRVSYKGRIGTVRETWFGFCSKHFEETKRHDCTCHPGAMIDWDDSTKRASSILFAKLTEI